MMPAELLVLCDTAGRAIGTAPRSECHSNPDLLHAVVHVIVTNARGELFLQKRSMSKDIAPGLWDTSVGGHIAPGESAMAAALREMREELGVAPGELTPTHQYAIRTRRESEFVHSFATQHEGPFDVDREEISDARFWSRCEIEAALGTGVFTPDFEEEYGRWLGWSGGR